MKIGFLDYVFDQALPVGSNGLSEVVWRLAAPLAAAGHEVHIAAPYARPDRPSPLVQVHTFPLPPIGYRNIVGHTLIVRRALAVLQRAGPFDVIHAPEYLSTAWAVLRQRTPVVLTEPGNIYERIANGNPYDWVTTQVFKLAAMISARGCARIIATSALIGEWWLRTGAVPAQLAAIPLGVDLDSFTRQPAAKGQLGWDAARPQLLFVARLSPETGASALLAALPAIQAACPAVAVQIVGSGPEQAALQAQAAQLGVAAAITWHGWLALDQLPLVYSAADVMVFPGLSGGTPRVMLQAMACGTPFVGTAIGGITDHITDGATGWLVPPGDVPALAQAVIAALSNRAEAARRAAAAQRAALALAWPHIAGRVAAEVYAPLVGGAW